MACRGVHFALTEADKNRLFECPPDDRAEFIGNEIEEDYFNNARQWVCETDKAWDAIHRAFTSRPLDYEYLSPLDGVILGGDPLYEKEDYIISYKTTDQVKEINADLEKINKARFKELYFKIDETDYGFPLSEEDFNYSWGWLKGLLEFYKLAVQCNRCVIFTADQ